MAIDSNTRRNWTRPETLAALHIYLQLPFGQLHQRNPKLIQLAQWLDRSPGSIALKLVNLASLDPVIVASGRSGMGNASALDREIWRDLQANWDSVALAGAAEYAQRAADHGVPADPDTQTDQTPETRDGGTFGEGKTRSVMVQQRVNQSLFRKAVLSSYNATCCISGLQHEKLVIASHIVPWSADTQNRLNPQNGLCLSALHDRAYDQGLITVMPDFTVRVSNQLKALKGDSFMAESLLRHDQQRIRSPERFAPNPEFLKWHATRFGFMG